MPYQERQTDEDLSRGTESDGHVLQAHGQPNSAKTVQIIIAVGLLAAIIVAVFGNY